MRAFGEKSSEYAAEAYASVVAKVRHLHVAPAMFQMTKLLEGAGSDSGRVEQSTVEARDSQAIDDGE